MRFQRIVGQPARCLVSTVLGLLVALVGSSADLPAQAMTLNIIYVNATTGDDSNAGTARYPVQTINEALSRADALVNPPVGLPQGAKISVFESPTPIAPVGFGGHEQTGWQPGTAAFPIRMISGVDIVGIRNPATTNRPRIEVQEVPLQPTYSWGSGPRAFVLGASGSALKRFVLDGTALEDASNTWGVVAIDATNFDIEHCDILEQHDGVRYFASEAGTCTGSLTSCTLSDFYPVVDPDLIQS